MSDRTLKYLITTEHEGEKISQFLSEKGYSEKILIRLRKDDTQVLVNNEPSYLNRVLQDKDELTIYLREVAFSEKIIPVDIPIEIIYEDDDIVVVNKPADMPIHPSINNSDNTLGNAMAYKFKDEGDKFVYRCINRLDRDTTGLTIIAKNMLSACVLSDEMVNRRIKRTYFAIVQGSFDKPKGTINKPIGRKDASTIERLIDFENGEEAITHYEVIQRGEDLTYLKLNLDTGRTHQIRVHMTSIGHPLIGDFLYNPKDTRMSRQALHAGELSFVHPISGEEMNFVVTMPKDMAKILETL